MHPTGWKRRKTRLDLFHILHGKYTIDFFESNINANHKEILDLGCGIGNMTCWIAEKYSTANIYGIDNSYHQLQIGKEIARNNSLNNIHFICNNIELHNELGNNYDVIYIRYLLIHLLDPIGALKYIKKYLKPNGKIIIEEPTMSTAFCYPSNQAYVKSRFLLKKLGNLKGFDFEKRIT